MQPVHDRTELAEDVQDVEENAEKMAWTTPTIRASAHFDKQALACSMADMSLICNGGSSSG